MTRAKLARKKFFKIIDSPLYLMKTSHFYNWTGKEMTVQKNPRNYKNKLDGNWLKLLFCRLKEILMKSESAAVKNFLVNFSKVQPFR